MAILFYNVRAYLGRSSFAQAVLAEGETIAAVGSSAALLCAAPPGTELVDGKGASLLPGFCDSHLHLKAWGSRLHRINVRGVRSIDELVEKARAELERPKSPEGILVPGGGWNQEEFTGMAEKDRRYPDRHDLDRISRDHGILLSRVCGHTACCNTLALKIAGISAQDLPGKGNVELDKNGEVLGVFHGKAIDALRSKVPPYSDAQNQEQLSRALAHAASQGLSSAISQDVYDNNYEPVLNAYRQVLNETSLRITLQCSFTGKKQLDEFARLGYVSGANLGHPLLTMGGIKLYADGSLGSRTALLNEPYADAPSTRGLPAMTREELGKAALFADRLGFQVLIHAIGDAGAANALAALETLTARGRNPGRNHGRHGIIHVEVADRDLLSRMASQDILVLTQPAFLAHDVYILEERLGKERAAQALPLKSLCSLGVRTSYGSDCPVESLNPLEGIQAALLRQDITRAFPEGGFFPEEAVDLETALDAFTLGGAYAAADEKRGRIKKGFKADLVLLDRDIFSVPQNEIKNTKVLYTLVGGRQAYRAAEISGGQGGVSRSQDETRKTLLGP
jgi:predicted amidohydrolase YtcJ